MSKHSFIDQLIIQADQALRTLVAGKDRQAERPSPGKFFRII